MQKTAYEIGVRLVGSEMCIRDRCVCERDLRWLGSGDCQNLLWIWVHMPVKDSNLRSEHDQTSVVKSALFYLFLISQQIVKPYTL